MLFGLTSARRRTYASAEHRVTASLAALVLALVGLVAIPVTPAQAAEVTDLTVVLDAQSPILAGEDGSFTVGADNTGPSRFNLGFTVLVPNGLTPGAATTDQGGAVGVPRVVASGALGAGQPPAGFQLWIWEDVSDLPAGADVRLQVPFSPDPVVFPVGSTIDIEAAAHASSDPTYRPVFPGSTGVGGTAAEAATASSAAIDAEVEVTALRIEKAQVTYPENELLRGAHEQGAVYELTVTNTDQGTTGVGGALTGVEVVDWLPAGLEFLGCANTDSSTHDWSGTEDGEYPGAGNLGGGVNVPGATCLAPTEVDTVVASASDAGTYGVAAGSVYTRVVWRLPSLAAGATETISYGVVVPLHENTVDWSAATGGVPTPGSLEQAANLDNNSGPSTRHGAAGSHEDGGAWTNAARASGHFDGPVFPGTDREVWDADTETITAMDLAIVKSVDRDDFAHGQVASYTLTVSASEYASSSDISVTDSIPDGMCLVPNPGSTNPGDCLSAPGTIFGDWRVEAIENGPGGTQVVTFVYWADPIEPNETVTLEYPVLMGVEYDTSGWGPTTGGDSFTNTVELRATTTPNGPTGESGQWRIWDDSQAGLGAPVATISKQVLARTALPGGGCSTVNPVTGDWHAGDPADPAGEFRLGDTVCYLLTVNFPTTVDTRNAVVSDVLPRGIAYVGSAAAAGGPAVSAPTVADQTLTWQVGSGSPRIVDASIGTLHLFVWGTVTPDAVNAVVDKPQNLMKYQQENVHGDVFFLRDQAETSIVPPPLSLLKGIRDVDDETNRTAASGNSADGADFNSNRDGIHVVEGEEITYRIDLTSEYEAYDVVVWDLLPAALNPLTAAGDVTALLSGLPGTATVQKGSTLGLSGADGNRWVIAWPGVNVTTAVGGEFRTTLEYNLTVTPEMAEVDTSHSNTAAVIRYEADVNGGGRQAYHPDDTLDYTGRPASDERIPTAEGGRAVDPSHVLVEGVDVTKRASSPVGLHNTGPAHPATAGSTQVAIGEWATYTYSVTVPAHTSVVNATLSDALPTPANWEIDADETRVTYPSGAWDVTSGGNTFTHAGGQFTVTAASGQLAFPAGTYTVGATDETFTVQITARIRPGATAWTHAPTSNPRTDTAQFRSSGSLKGSAQAQTYLVEPDPRVSKVADDDTIVAEQLVTYTLEAWNVSGRPTSFDTVVVDCVPAGLAVQLPVTAPGTTSVIVDPASPDCAGTLITWTIGHLAAEGSTPGAGEIASRQVLSYTVEIDPAAGGGVRYDNTATVTGYSVPDDRTDPTDPDPRRRHQRTATEQITAISPTIVKTVDGGPSATAVVGEIVDYEVVVTIPADINLYDTTIVDAVPTGIAISDVEIEYGPTWVTPPGATPSVSGQTITLDLGDVASAAVVRTVTITYRGTVEDVAGTSNGTSLENTATLAWNGVDDDATTRTPIDDDATVTVREPSLDIQKLVDHPTTAPAAQDGIAVDAGGAFHYSVVVTNVGTSPAYDVEIVDTVPAGVVVVPASISPAGALGAVDAVTGERTITWTLTSLGVGANQTFTYSGTLATSSTLDGSALRNVAEVTEYFSHPTGPGYDDTRRRQYSPEDDDARVTPLFPDPIITKRVDPAVTALGESVGFEIVVGNDGDSPLTTYRVEDTLPAGWSVDNLSPAPTSQSGSVATGLTLVWEGGPLAVGGETTITYEATPDLEHPWTAASLGLAAAAAHTNTVRVTGTDGSGAPGHLDPVTGDPVPYEDDSEASVNVPLANLELTKAVVPDWADVVAGGQISWELRVRNLGPDAEAGPVTITDTIPDGVIAESISDFLFSAGLVWVPVSYDAGSRELTLSYAGGVPAPLLGAPGTIPPISVTAVVDPGYVPDGSPSRNLTNTARVDGTTDELEKDNNVDDVTVPVYPRADLELDKTAVTGSYVPGTFITWEIDVTNHGPSVSRTPFTVTDTLPSEVDPTTFELLSGEDWSVVGGAPVGNVVTFTYGGDDLGVDDVTSTLRFRVEVRSDLLTVDPIVNAATVTPRTPEPPDSTDNNSDEAPVGHGTALADLSLVKSLASDDVVAGEGGRYRIEVANDGPSYAVDVTVTDTLPAGLAYAGGLVSQTGDTWSLDDEQLNGDGTTTLTFVLESGSGMLPDGDTTWFEFDVDVASWVTADVTNVAEVSSPTPDPDPDNNDDTETTTPLVETNLSVTKVHDAAVRRVGDLVVFTVQVTNHGPADADDVELVDAPPAGLTFEGLSDVFEPTDGRGWAHAVVDDVLTATLDDPLPAHETAVVEITATLTPASFPSVTNVVSVTTTTDETDPDDNSATDPVPVDSPDLRVVKTADAESVQGGDRLTYTVVVTNHGGAHADVVTLTDTLPAELEHLSSTWDETNPAHAVGDECVLTGADGEGLGGTLDCELPAGLAAGQSATLTVTLAVPFGISVDTVTNTVEVASDDEDPSLRGDNDDDETVPVRWLRITPTAACVLDAPWLSLEIDARNVASGLPVTLAWYADADDDGTPDGPAIHTQTLDVFSVDGDLVTARVLWPGAATDEDGVGTAWPGFRPVVRGETPTWQHHIEDESLPEHALREGTLVRVSINPEQWVQTSYPHRTADCVPVRDADVEITKTADVEQVDAGGRITYTLQVSNLGKAVANDVVVTDRVPEQLKVERVRTARPAAADAMAWSECTVAGQDDRGYGGTVRCELDGPLARGQVAPAITVVTSVDPDAETGDVVNVAEVRWAGGDDETAGGSDDDDAQVEVRADDDATDEDDEELGVTGAEAFRLLGFAVVLGLLGWALVLVSRRRRDAPSEG